MARVDITSITEVALFDGLGLGQDSTTLTKRAIIINVLTKLLLRCFFCPEQGPALTYKEHIKFDTKGRGSSTH